MTLVSLYFAAHQPIRLRPYELRPPQKGLDLDQLCAYYFDEEGDGANFRRVAQQCYYPATRTILDLIRQSQNTDKPFKVAYGLSGTFLMQAQRFEPELVSLFQQLAETGMVEFTAETYYHSLASLFEGDRAEFKTQVKLHADEIERLFGQRPTVFRNTECLYNNTIADLAIHMGFDGIITEGVDWLMEGWRSPDYLYQSTDGLPVLLRDYRLSGEIACQFADPSRQNQPLTADRFAGWLVDNPGTHVLLAMDYETFGEHTHTDKGIFDFLRALPAAIKQHPQLEFTTPTEAIQRLPRVGVILVNDFATISWTDQERDTSAWLGNKMQQFAFEETKRMEGTVRATDDPDLLEAWRLMQASDLLYDLSDKPFRQGDVHQHFGDYTALFDHFVRLQTALTDLQRRANLLIDEA